MSDYTRNAILLSIATMGQPIVISGAQAEGICAGHVNFPLLSPCSGKTDQYCILEVMRGGQSDSAIQWFLDTLRLSSRKEICFIVWYLS